MISDRSFSLTPFREDIRPLQVYRKELHRLLLRWETLTIVFSLILFSAIMVPGDFLSSLGVAHRGIITAVLCLLFAAFNFLLLPWILWGAARRNLPWVPVQMGCYVVLSLLCAVVALWSAGLTVSMFAVGWLFVVIITHVAIGYVVFVLRFASEIPARVSEDPERFPLFWPMPVQTCRLQPLLAPDIQGRVLRMVVENQYLRVTTETGEEVIRCSLGQAEQLVAAGTGLRIHRSYWIARDQIDELFFENGNPRLKTTAGEVLPVSRSAQEMIRSL
jgi:hypothetical protein